LDITVCVPAPSDIPSILQIEHESQPEPWTQESFREEIERESLFVARPAGTADIAGYICFWCVADEVQILNVAVTKALRRRGIARTLMDFAIGAGQARQARAITLEVRQGNATARRFYQSLGFRITGERPGYYGAHTESAILMELDIEPNVP
jgi:ribosomal-protein-alanine N-acetyltransferase